MFNDVSLVRLDALNTTRILDVAAFAKNSMMGDKHSLIGITRRGGIRDSLHVLQINVFL